MAAVAVTVMTVGATALVTDHAWLVDQRDVLKTATDAAAVATTLELSRQLDLQPGISDADLAAILEPIARRYILLNLVHLDADRYARAEQSLVVQVIPDRRQRTVDVAAEAELGGVFLSRLLPFMADSLVAERMRAESIVETFINPIEVVLAIDISDSMKKAVDSDRQPPRGSDTPTRMAVVKMAAANLVAVLAPDDENRIAIGVVPWANVVRLDEQTRDRWERNGWARYPTRRVYGVPYRCKPNRTCPDPPPVTQDVAASPPEAWLGCLDEHRMGSLGTLASLPAAAELLWPPVQSAFAQNYFAAHHSYAYVVYRHSSPGHAISTLLRPAGQQQDLGEADESATLRPGELGPAVADPTSEHRPCRDRTGDRGARTRGVGDILDTRCPVGPAPAPALVEGRLGGDQAPR